MIQDELPWQKACSVGANMMCDQCGTSIYPRHETRQHEQKPRYDFKNGYFIPKDEARELYKLKQFTEHTLPQALGETIAEDALEKAKLQERLEKFEQAAKLFLEIEDDEDADPKNPADWQAYLDCVKLFREALANE